MIRIFVRLTILLLIFGCNSTNKEKRQTKIEKEIPLKTEKQVEPKIEVKSEVIAETEEKEISKLIPLKERIDGLKSDCFSKSMNMIFADNGNPNEVVDENTEEWIFGLEIKDSLQFEPADILRPLCKISESNEILSVAFSDFADYKQAIHIFNFDKLDFKPTSSFVIYSIGGDAEQFWETTYEKLDEWTYKIIETEGRYEFGESETKTIIEVRKTRNISIDKLTGILTKEQWKMESDLVETE